MPAGKSVPQNCTSNNSSYLCARCSEKRNNVVAICQKTASSNSFVSPTTTTGRWGKFYRTEIYKLATAQSMKFLLINPSLIDWYPPNFKHLLRTNVCWNDTHCMKITQWACPFREKKLGSVGSNIWIYQILDLDQSSRNLGRRRTLCLPAKFG